MGRIRVGIAKWIGLVIVAGTSALLGYDFITARLSDRWDARAPRHPDGILVGAEELDLGPSVADAAVLLVHGFIGGSNNFNALPRQLADKGYRVRAMRLPGHGTSPTDFARTTFEDLLGAVVSEINILKDTHERVFVVSHSMGGALTALAAAEVEEVDGIVLGAPYFGVTHKWFYVLPPETWNALTGRFVRRVYKGDAFIQVADAKHKRDIFSYRWVPSRCVELLIEIGKRAKATNVLESVTCPVLHFHGPGDIAADYGKSRKAFEALGSAHKEFVTLERSNHHIYWDYDAEEVNEAILRFIERDFPQDSDV